MPVPAVSRSLRESASGTVVLCRCAGMVLCGLCGASFVYDTKRLVSARAMRSRVLN